MNLNKILNGAKSFFAMIALVAGWIVTFSNILPPKIVGYAQAVMGLLTLLHAWKAQYSDELSKIAGQIGIDIPGLKIAVLILPLFAASANAQMFSTSKARGAVSYLSTALANDAGPDTIVLVSGGGVYFDTMTAPFPIELSITEYQMVAGVQIPVAPTYFEDCKVTYVGNDTLVIGTRAMNGTVRRAWGPGTKVEVGPSLSYIAQLIDTASALSAATAKVRLSADTSITGQSLTGTPLKFPVGVSQVWEFEVGIYDSSSSAAGVKFGWSIPTNATIVSLGFGQTSGVTAFTSDIITAGATAGAANATAGGYSWYRATGTITTDASNSGTVILQFLKVTSGTAIVKAGSYIIARRIS